MYFRYEIEASGFSPKTGASTGGVQLTIAGIGFSKNTNVTFKKVTSSSKKRRSTDTGVQGEVKITDQNFLKVVVPELTDGSYEIYVSKCELLIK